MHYLSLYRLLIGTGFPSARANADWGLLTDFLIGLVGSVGCVRFWFSRFGDGAEFSDVVEDCFSSSSPLNELFLGVLVDFALDFSSVWRLIPRGLRFVCRTADRPFFCGLCPSLRWTALLSCGLLFSG